MTQLGSAGYGVFDGGDVGANNLNEAEGTNGDYIGGVVWDLIEDNDVGFSGKVVVLGGWCRASDGERRHQRGWRSGASFESRGYCVDRRKCG
ncbi:Phytase family [Sesbania bispinosa]|nr:Phytase family [Sesbania bispinosa]